MRRTTKLAAVLFAILFAGTLLNVDGQAKRLKIALMNPVTSTAYQAPLIAGCKARANELGADFTLFDGEKDPLKMYAQCLDIINQKYDGVILKGLDVASGTKIVKKFTEAKIPVVTMTSRVGPEADDLIVAHVGADTLQQGESNGKIVADLFKTAGQINIAIIQGIESQQASTDREQGFEAAIKGLPNLKIIAKQFAQYDKAKAMSVMENYLTAYPKIDVVYCHDDVMASGAIEAIKASGRKLGKGGILVLGIGGSRDGVKNILSGALYASVNQPPEIEGALGAETIIKHLRGEKVEKWVKTICDPITLANASTFDPKW